MAESVQALSRRYPAAAMSPGDVFITNDPWKGTGHLNDFVVVTPCFRDGKAVALFCATSHVMDIGGLGFGPDGSGRLYGRPVHPHAQAVRPRAR